MKLRYVGPHTEGVEIPSLGITVAHGESIEVDDAIGKTMAETEEWQPVGRAKKGGDDE